MKRYVLTVDLKDDPRLVAEYKAHHRRVWPEVRRSLRRGFAAHAASDPRCAEWEALMRGYQEPPPGARPGEVWARMDRVFHLAAALPRARRRPRSR